MIERVYAYVKASTANPPRRTRDPEPRMSARLLLLGPVEPVDHFPHALAEALVAAAISTDQNGDEQNGQANFHHCPTPLPARTDFPPVRACCAL